MSSLLVAFVSRRDGAEKCLHADINANTRVAVVHARNLGTTLLEVLEQPIKARLVASTKSPLYHRCR
jgi:hypothetical protein